MYGIVFSISLSARLKLFVASTLMLPALVAYAAVNVFDPTTTRFWVALACVQFIGVMGFCASSLPTFAGWVDSAGTPVEILERRLVILRGLIVAQLAANICYYGGYYYMDITEIGCFIASSVAAYGGDKFLTPLLARITGVSRRPADD